VLEPFFLRALAAAVGLALAAAPLGCFVVWGRMAYIGETIAQAGLIGVALGLLLKTDPTASVLTVTIAVAGLLVLLGRQQLVPLDSILGLMAHAALAVGVIAAALVRGPSIDLMGYLFGDIFAVTSTDLLWVWGGGLLVIGALTLLWRPLLAVSVHPDLAAAEGVDRDRVRALFTLLLAVVIAIAMKIVGALLVIAVLIMPAVAARAFADTPERMAVLATVVAVVSVALGLGLSLMADIPGGPAIVLVLSIVSGTALAITARRAV
jgi:zinc transport system permease protein